MITATTMEMSGGSKHANFVIHNGSKMISVSVDNSGGRMHSMARADIRLLFTDPLKGGVEDVTSTVFGGRGPCRPPARRRNDARPKAVTPDLAIP